MRKKICSYNESLTQRIIRIKCLHLSKPFLRQMNNSTTLYRRKNIIRNFSILLMDWSFDVILFTTNKYLQTIFFVTKMYLFSIFIMLCSTSHQWIYFLMISIEHIQLFNYPMMTIILYVILTVNINISCTFLS
jgi:hypothetical protein